MGKTATILLKIARVLMIIICILCIVAVIGSVGKIESGSDPTFGYYTRIVIAYCAGAVLSFGASKITDQIIKIWGC